MLLLTKVANIKIRIINSYSISEEREELRKKELLKLIT